MSVDCSICRFYEAGNDIPNQGECKRHAPVVYVHEWYRTQNKDPIMKMKEETVFPVVKASGSCGDWETRNY